MSVCQCRPPICALVRRTRALVRRTRAPRFAAVFFSRFFLTRQASNMSTELDVAHTRGEVERAGCLGGVGCAGRCAHEHQRFALASERVCIRQHSIRQHTSAQTSISALLSPPRESAYVSIAYISIAYVSIRQRRRASALCSRLRESPHTSAYVSLASSYVS